MFYLFVFLSLFIWFPLVRLHLVKADILDGWELMILTVPNKSYSSCPFQVHLFVNAIGKNYENIAIGNFASPCNSFFSTLSLITKPKANLNLGHFDSSTRDGFKFVFCCYSNTSPKQWFCIHVIMVFFWQRKWSKLWGWWCLEIDQKSGLVYKVIQCTTW